MATTRKPTRKLSKDSKQKDLKPTKVSSRTAGQIKGGRRDRLSANHNETVRSR